jgi:hypothetical protein
MPRSNGGSPVPVVSVEFDYDGRHRVVDNVSWREHDSTGGKVLVGLEILVDGELVAQSVKRYLVDLIRDLRFVDPEHCLALREDPRPVSHAERR